MPSSTLHRASHDRARLAALWTGVLAGPIVYLLLLEVNNLLSYVACETRQKWFLHLATVIAIAMVAAAGLVGWRASLGHPLEQEVTSPALSDETAVQRVRWLAAASATFSVGFILLIIATHIPVVVLKVCQ